MKESLSNLRQRPRWWISRSTAKNRTRRATSRVSKFPSTASDQPVHKAPLEHQELSAQQAPQDPPVVLAPLDRLVRLVRKAPKASQERAGPNGFPRPGRRSRTSDPFPTFTSTSQPATSGKKSAAKLVLFGRCREISTEPRAIADLKVRKANPAPTARKAPRCRRSTGPRWNRRQHRSYGPDRSCRPRRSARTRRRVADPAVASRRSGHGRVHPGTAALD
jgi:hypothetical protein